MHLFAHFNLFAESGSVLFKQHRITMLIFFVWSSMNTVFVTFSVFRIFITVTVYDCYAVQSLRLCALYSSRRRIMKKQVVHKARRIF